MARHTGLPDLSVGYRSHVTSSSEFTLEEKDIATSPTGYAVAETYGSDLFDDVTTPEVTVFGPGVDVISSPYQEPRIFYGGKGVNISFDDSIGGEDVVIKHPTGGSIVIDKDGSVHLYGCGKGITFHTPSGDVAMNGQNVLISADATLNLESKHGDVNIIGKNINFKAREKIKQVAYGFDSTISGAYSLKVADGDKNEIISGHNRVTVAGNMRTQVTGNRITDIGGTELLRTDGATEISVEGTLDILSKSDTTMQVNSGNFAMRVSGNTNIETSVNLDLLTTGITKIESEGRMDLASLAAMSIAADNNLSLSSDAAVNIAATDNINVDGTEIHMQEDVASVIGVSLEGLASIKFNDFAEYVGANTIIDELSTKRLFPDDQRNGKLHATPASGDVEDDLLYDELKKNSGNPTGFTFEEEQFNFGGDVLGPSPFGEDTVLYSQRMNEQGDLIADIDILEKESKKRGIDV